MKKLAFSLMLLTVLGMTSAAFSEEENKILTYNDEEYDTDDDYYMVGLYQEEEEYLASCAGGKCPREMVERLRREKQAERARLKGEQSYEDTGLEPIEEYKGDPKARLKLQKEQAKSRTSARIA